MRFEWVLMDIPKQCQEIIPVSNWLALESLLKEMSYPSILVIVVIYIRRGYALHDLSEGLTGFFDEKVDMVSHQAVGIYHTVWF